MARDLLRRGLLWLLPGAGLLLFIWLASGNFGSVWSALGILMSCVGLAYLLTYLLEGRRSA